jgi:DNA polymerase
VIVALGSTAARLFGASHSIRAARKAKLQFVGHLLRITFHPAYVRRFGGRRGDAWRQMIADLRQAWEESGIYADLRSA